MDQQNKLETGAPWGSVFTGEGKAALEELLPGYIRGRRWFSAKARTIKRVRITDAAPFSRTSGTDEEDYITFIEVEYAEGDRQTFVLPLAFATDERAAWLSESQPGAVVASLKVDNNTGVLYDASSSDDFARALLSAIGAGTEFGGDASTISAWSTPVFEGLASAGDDPLTPRVVGVEQSNTSIIYGKSLILKLFRRLEGGTSPDLEIGHFLTERGFANTPPLAGAVERQVPGGESLTLAILQGFAPNKGDAWSYTLEELDAYYEHGSAVVAAPVDADLLDLAAQETPAAMVAAIGPYLQAARLLGRRTAEMHLALSSDPDNAAFAPEPFTVAYQSQLFESVRGLLDNAFGLLSGRLTALPDEIRPQAKKLLAGRDEILARFNTLRSRELSAQRTRVHGDYHLGQVLWNGEDYVIIDFEGEPLRSLAERRTKHSPLKDVAGMVRSFHYAAYAALFNRGQVSDAGERRAASWYNWVAAAYLGEYLSVAQQGTFLPASRDDLRVLLDSYLLEKAIYELIYELNNRPDWVQIPLQGVAQLAG